MRLKKFIFTIICASFLWLLLICSSFAQTGTVTADILKVRSSTGTSSLVINRVTFGSELELLSYDGAWYKVQLSDGTIGYVSAEYITPNVAYYGTVSASSLMLRSSTGTASPIIGRLSNSELVELLSYDGAWYKVRLSDGLTGYASADYITPVNKTTPTSVTNEVQPAQSSGYYGYVNINIAKLHASIGDFTPVSSVVLKGEKLELLAYDGAWYKVNNTAGLTGFVNASYISLTADYLHTYENYVTGYVDATGLNIRQNADTNSFIMSTLSTGSSVNLISFDGTWYQLRMPDGSTGYAMGDYIALNPITYTIANEYQTPQNAVAWVPPTELTYSLGSKIIQTAYQHMGKPYVYSAAGPDSFDCSGFTMYVMGIHGISLPHQSGSQYACGFSVTKSELIAGDLVFFNSNSTSGVAHVGIYIGNGQFIHASSGKAYSVTISSLTDDYYTAHYLGARRVI